MYFYLTKIFKRIYLFITLKNQLLNVQSSLLHSISISATLECHLFLDITWNKATQLCHLQSKEDDIFLSYTNVGLSAYFFLLRWHLSSCVQLCPHYFNNVSFNNILSQKTIIFSIQIRRLCKTSHLNILFDWWRTFLFGNREEREEEGGYFAQKHWLCQWSKKECILVSVLAWL